MLIVSIDEDTYLRKVYLTVKSNISLSCDFMIKYQLNSMFSFNMKFRFLRVPESSLLMIFRLYVMNIYISILKVLFNNLNFCTALYTRKNGIGLPLKSVEQLHVSQVSYSRGSSNYPDCSHL